jgi:Transposase domain (DUF772)
MVVSLQIYSYATGTFGSRRIEQSTYNNVAVRFITADTHPDHDTICTFRWENKALLSELFVKVLEMARELNVLKVGQITVSVDDTKVLANASKHLAVSYERAGEMIQELDLAVEQLMKKAEQADATPLEDGLTIPESAERKTPLVDLNRMIIDLLTALGPSGSQFMHWADGAAEDNMDLSPLGGQVVSQLVVNVCRTVSALS